MIATRRDQLRALLFGEPLTARERLYPEELGEELNACLRGVMLILAEEVGECDALDQARLEWSRIISMEADYAGLAAKRAALLFALHREEAVRECFVRSDPELLEDLRDRVLPMTIPSFLAGMGQSPDALVALVTLLVELPGEALGGLGGGVNEEEGAEDGTEDEEKGRKRSRGRSRGRAQTCMKPLPPQTTVAMPAVARRRRTGRRRRKSVAYFE